MTAATYELTYFDAPGRAEHIRPMLHAAGIDFKDNRFHFKDWAKIQPGTPLGVVPTMKIGNTTYCQSNALARYAAKLAGFYPEDPLEALIVDEVMDTCSEIMSTAPQDPDPETKKNRRQEWQAGGLTKFSNHIEKRIQEAGGKSVIKTPSVADLAVWAVVDGIKRGFYDHVDAAFFDTNYPGIVATCGAIMEEPKIKAYYDSLA
mmetsp:Transcript_18052/g.29913  ORF Transcript_18052/g.29913 Transcript_18052/m.29913 type:complete len:204 (-) Transcript_18052:196-807(-)|eukprot:CAMPEP_0119006054 /NCGR_PEP_ID=MMETSP1176-20130426/2088_1 /TAXON_ID=265551 /ORGANISM="Synedropsis recta cf, Strain CCMP1620" /LENGTH=203 /DNA_ID=CAMNT_0006957941 /DNA_START=159 /DNA_END=770 /DNA_ORIENTATION=+